MRKDKEKGAKGIEKKSADTLMRQGLGYAKLADREEAANEAEERSLKKKHEIYDNTYYIAHNKTRIIGIFWPKLNWG